MICMEVKLSCHETVADDFVPSGHEERGRITLCPVGMK